QCRAMWRSMCRLLSDGDGSSSPSVVIPAKAGIQYSRAVVMEARRRGVLDTPLSRSMTSCVWDVVRTSCSKHLLLRPRQREPAPVRVEAGDARLFRRARKPAALPHLAVSEHRQRIVHHGVAMADAGGGALGVHLEGAAVIEVAIGGSPRLCFHGADVAAERVLLVVVEILAGDVFRRRLEAGRAGLGHGPAGCQRQNKYAQASETDARHVSFTCSQPDATYVICSGCHHPPCAQLRTGADDP